MTKDDTLSVVMPVHNALPFLDEAVRSILDQSHRDFEFVIGNDASTDGSSEALREWAARDSRIRLLERRDNLGPAGSSNWVVRAARGRLIARMDADDIAHPDRLSRQLAALRNRGDAVLVGSIPVCIDESGRPVLEQYRWVIGIPGFNAPLAHGSVMFRRQAFEEAGGYRPACAFWEDADLYLRIARLGHVLIMPDPLYFYRFANTSTRLTSTEDRVERAVDLMIRCRRRYEQGGDYEDLLAATAPRPAGERINAAVFLSIGAGRIWTCRSPRMLWRMCRRAAFPRDRGSAMAWLIILWGTLHPRSLRFLLRRRSRARNRDAIAKYPDGQLYEWRSRPPGPTAAASLETGGQDIA